MSARRLDAARALVASLAMVLLTLGCGSDGAISREDQGPAGDAGASDQGVFLDGAVVDQGVPTGLLFPADSARFAPFLAAAQDAFPPVADDRPAPWTTCYASASGCDSAPCSLLASCCVASGRCAELQVDALLPPAVLFSSCASGADALSCVPGQTFLPLGSSTPTVEAGGLRPGGDAMREGGLLVGAPLDLMSDRVDLSVVFAPPSSCPGNACLESAGVSLAHASELALGVVSPLVGLLYSPSRGDVSLVMGDQVRMAWALVDPAASFTLEVHPSGRVRVLRDNVLLTEAFTYTPRADAQVVLHGRNTELQGARLRSLHALRYRTEAPATFGTRSVIALNAPLGVSPWAPRGAAVSTHEGRHYAVVENDGALYRGELLGLGVDFESTQRVTVDASRSERALSAPMLLVRPSGEAFLVYAAELTDGSRTIRARRGVDGPLGPLPEILELADAGPGHALDDPSLLEHAGYFLLLVRHRWPDGSSALELWMSDAATTPALRDLVPAPASNLSELTAVDSADANQAGVQAPSLSVRGGTYRVHYERRTGTRRVIELLAADELRAFRALGEVLLPRPGEQDRLGVGSPSALEGTAGAERLYYLGDDGLGERLFVTERPGVEDPTPL
ncbi:MAG: hypothetical protein KC593_01565 [Myxococcales bacterium]|nr:hypothetical protein [Myxococcales bacterium]